MKINIKKILGIWVPILLIVIVYGLFHLVTVRADNTGGGSSSDYGACSYQWCWNAGGVRLALYKYDGATLNYYGHRDHCSTVGDLGCPSGSAYQDATVSGKVAHQKVSGYASGTWSSKTISINNTYKFSDIQDGWDNLEQETKALFSLDTNNNATILSALKQEFTSASSLTEADLKYIYITIEPTVLFTDTTASRNYYGTAYEFAYKYQSGEYLEGVVPIVYVSGGEWIQASTMSGTDNYNFVGTNGNMVKLVPTSELYPKDKLWSSQANRATNAQKIISTSGYGINVFWLKNYTTEVVVKPTCTISQINDRQFQLNINGNATSYGISNTQVANGQTIYTSGNTSETIYGVVSNSGGSSTCQLSRTSYSCTVNSTDGINYTLTHNLPSNYLNNIGLSNTSGNLNGNSTYKANNSDTRIYGVVKGTSGQIYTCEASRTPYSCEISKQGNTDVYNLTVKGQNVEQVLYGISNISNTINNKKTYTAINTDKTIYGAVADKNGNVITSCSLKRTPVTCTISTTDDKTYTLTINNPIDGLKGIVYGYTKLNVSSTDNKNTYLAKWNDVKIKGIVSYSDGKEMTTCEVTREEETCLKTCAGKEGDSLLSCAENFCQMSENDTSSKKTCITTCGYTEPEFKTCPDDIKENGKNTECKSDTQASYKTCTPATEDNYYKMVCEENTGVTYPNNLPKVLLPGTGFTYEAKLIGKKTCELVFEREKWIFDYASSYTDKEREELVSILEKYISKVETIDKEELGLYEYYSDDAEIYMIITEKDKDEEIKVLLEAKETNNLLKEDLQKIEGPDIKVYLYKNGTKTELDIYKYLRMISSNETIYQLRGICKSKTDSNYYEPKDGVCLQEDELVNEYITDSSITVKSYDTKVIVNKESSNLEVYNTCYYSVNKPTEEPKEDKPEDEKPEEVNPETGDDYIIPIIAGLFLMIGVAGFTYKKINEKKNNI